MYVDKFEDENLARLIRDINRLKPGEIIGVWIDVEIAEMETEDG